METTSDPDPPVTGRFPDRTTLIHLLIIGGCLAAVFHPLVFQDTLPGDMDNLYFLYAQRALIHHGEGVFWNPYQFSGFAAYRDPNLSLFYPPSWLYYVFPLRETFVLMVFGHYLFAAAGFLWLGHVLGLRPMSRFLGAVSFCLGSYLLGRFLNHSLLLTAAFAPWVFAAFHRTLEERRVRWAGTTGLYLGLQILSGMPHNAAFMMIALAVYSLWRSVERRSAAPVYWWCGSVFLACGLAAVQLAPTAAGIRDAVRQRQTIEQAGDLALAPAGIPEFLLGGTDRRGEAINEFLATTCYPAVAVVLLVPFAFFGKRRSLAEYLFVLTVLAVLLALGPSTPVYGLFSRLPAGRLFNIPGRFLFLAGWTVPLLGALGAERLAKRGPEDAWIQLLSGVLFTTGVIVLAGFSVGGWDTLWKTAARPRLVHGEAFMLANLAVFGTPAAGILFAYRSGRIGGRILSIALSALVVLDLLHFSVRLKREYVPTDSTAAVKTIEEAKRRVREEGPCRVLGYQGNFSRPLSSNEKISPALMVPKFANLYRLEDIQGFSPLHTLRYNEAVHSAAGSVRGTGVLRWVLVRSARAPLLDVLGMRYIIGEPYDALALPEQRRIEPGKGLELTIDTGGGRVRELVLVSCTDLGTHLAAGEKVAEFAIENASGEKRTVPIRAGMETADFRLSFPGFSRGHEAAPIHRVTTAITGAGVFSGQVYISRIPFEVIAGPTQIRIRNTTAKSLFIVLEASLTFVPDDRFRRVFEADGIRLYENPRCFPRAWWVAHGIRVESGAAAREILVEGGFDPATSVLLESGRDTEAQVPAMPAGGEGSLPQGAKVVEWRPGFLEVEVNAPEAGYLVASEMDDFGWRVTVDGERVKRLRANGLMVAAAVDAGVHRVHFRFVPEDAVAGGVISLISLILLAGMLVRGRDGRARPSGDIPGARGSP